MLRIVIFGAAWLVILAVVLIALRTPHPASMSAVETTVDSAAPLPPSPPPRAGTRFPGWTVTRSYSAHHMMVVEVETDIPETARQIAAQLVEPLKDRYDEILVYVRRPDARQDDLAARRVQWTKRGGYVETVFNSEQ